MKPSFPTLIVLLALLVTSTGCYHASVTTGLAPGTQTIEKPWAMSFVFGLIPPQAVDASSCANGVAQVETELSFLNQLASALTGGLITPMTITVTCAAGMSTIDGAEVHIASDAPRAEILGAIEGAAQQSRDLDAPVIIRFE